MSSHGCEVRKLLKDIRQLAEEKVPKGGDKTALWARLRRQAQAAIEAFDGAQGDFRQRLSEVFYTLALIGFKELGS